MKKFTWVQPDNIDEAQRQINAVTATIATGKTIQGAAVIKAGGVDLLDLMKENIIAPAKIVSINALPGLGKIGFDEKSGLRIGALVKLSDLEENAEIKKHYAALHESVSHAATPQIRNMATLGGNLAQRPRCWYFRSEDHKCLKKGGTKCFAQEGQNQIHGIFNTEICPCVHSSSVSTALVAFGAQVEITGAKGKLRNVPLAEFFVSPQVDVTRENILERGEIITALTVPAPPKGQKSWYIKQAAKESYDWALADAAVVAQMSGDTIKDVKIVLGAAAPTPYRATAAEQLLRGQKVSEKLAVQVGTAAVEGATPLAHNAYKVPMFKAIVKECVLNLV